MSTNKSSKYLSLGIKNSNIDLSQVYVTESSVINSSFKLINKAISSSPITSRLSDVIEHELQKLGYLIFVLIGELQESEISVPVNHKKIKTLVYQPLSLQPTSITPNEDGALSIIINKLNNQESNWNELISYLLINNSIHDFNENHFISAYNLLNESARLKIILPTSHCVRPENSFLIKIIETVREQNNQYKMCLDKYLDKPGENGSAFTDVLRIAYNFSVDVTKVLKLLISISDLKPIVLWCTIFEQFYSEQKLRELPGMDSDQKGLLSKYVSLISDARNQAFHNLFTFDRTLEADLEGINIKAKKITFLPLHNKKANVLDYEDREMVELLSELTRAKQIDVPEQFWEKNFFFMQSLEQYLVSIENSLWLLFQASNN